MFACAKAGRGGRAGRCSARTRPTRSRRAAIHDQPPRARSHGRADILVRRERRRPPVAWRGLRPPETRSPTARSTWGEGLLFTVSTSSVRRRRGASTVAGRRGGVSHWKSLGHFPGGATRLALLPSAAAAAADARRRRRHGGARARQERRAPAAAVRRPRAPAARRRRRRTPCSELVAAARAVGARRRGASSGGDGGRRCRRSGLLLSSSLDGAVVAWSAAGLEPVWAMLGRQGAAAPYSGAGCAAGTGPGCPARRHTSRWGRASRTAGVSPCGRRGPRQRRSPMTALAPPLCDETLRGARRRGPRRPRLVDMRQGFSSWLRLVSPGCVATDGRARPAAVGARRRGRAADERRRAAAAACTCARAQARCTTAHTTPPRPRAQIDTSSLGPRAARAAGEARARDRSPRSCRRRPRRAR